MRAGGAAVERSSMTTRRQRRALCVAAALASAPVCSSHAVADEVGAAKASATDREQARRLVALGDERMAAGDYQAAYDAFRGADVLMGVPTTALQVARAEVALGRLLDARATLDRLSRLAASEDEPAAFGAARRAADDLRRDLDERIPTLRVVVSGDTRGERVVVTVDGASSPAAEGGQCPSIPALTTSPVGFAVARSRAAV